MASYTETATPNLLSSFWLDNLKWIVLTSSSTAVLLRNQDMSLTLVNGSGFVFDGGDLPIDGTVTMLRHFNSTQSLQHATITGISIKLLDLFDLFASIGDTIMSGADTITGTASNSTFWGYDGDDVFTVGIDSFINAAGGNDTINNFSGPGSENDWISYKFSPDGTLNNQAMFISLNANNSNTEFLMTGFAQDKATNGSFEFDSFDHVNHVEATNGDDVVIGGKWDHILFGDFTGSTILGLGGNDIILNAWEAHGGSGNDRISLMKNGISMIGNISTGGTGFGDDGDDTLLIEAFGTLGKPSETYLLSFDGGDGTDTADSQTTNSASFSATYDLPVSTITIADGIGNTVLYTVTSIENVDAGNVADFIAGTNLANVLRGFGGDDQIFGNGGDDIIEGGAGDDILDGGADIDTASYEGATAGVTQYLLFTGLDTGGAGIDTLSGIENLTGSDFADRLIGDGNDNVLIGNEGDDVLKGKGGNDTFHGEDGDDTMTGGMGDDTMFGGAGNDTLIALGGLDTLNGGDDDDFLFGGQDNDILNGDGGIDNIRGNRGVDTISGGADSDTLRGGGQNDTIDGDGGNDFLFGENHSDTLFGGAGDDSLTGGVGGGALDGFTDTFIYKDTGDGGGGFDRIKDFENGIDVMDLQSFGFGSFAAVQALASDTGSGLRIDFGGGDVLFVENFLLANFDLSDVIL